VATDNVDYYAPCSRCQGTGRSFPPVIVKYEILVPGKVVVASEGTVQGSTVDLEFSTEKCPGDFRIHVEYTRFAYERVVLLAVAVGVNIMWVYVKQRRRQQILRKYGYNVHNRPKIKITRGGA